MRLRFGTSWMRRCRSLLVPASASVASLVRRREGVLPRALDRKMRIGILLLALPVSMALLSLCLPRESTAAIHLASRLGPLEWEHPLGTDELGRDQLWRVAGGARVSLVMSVLVVSMSAVIGLLLGGAAGYRRGGLDHGLAFLIDTVLSFPPLLLALALIALMGPGLSQLLVALVATGWVSYARLTRSLVVGLRGQGFIEALRALGIPSWRILLRHVFPNISRPILLQSVLDVPVVILLEGGLSFLGLGVQPPRPSWGSMLNEGRRHLVDCPALAVFPGLLMIVTLLGLHLIGDAMAERVDPGVPARRRQGG